MLNATKESKYAIINCKTIEIIVHFVSYKNIPINGTCRDKEIYRIYGYQNTSSV